MPYHTEVTHCVLRVGKRASAGDTDAVGSGRPMTEYDSTECESSVTADDSIVRPLTRLAPEECRHVTFAVDIDVSELDDDQQALLKAQAGAVAYCFRTRLSERTSLNVPSRAHNVTNLEDGLLSVAMVVTTTGLTPHEKQIAHRLAATHEDILMSLVQEAKTTTPDSDTVRNVVENARTLSVDDERVSIDGRFPAHDYILSSLLFGIHRADSTQVEVIDDTIRIIAVDNTYTFESEKDTVEIEIIADTDTYEVRRLTVTSRLDRAASSSASTSATSDTVATTDGGLIVADDDGEILTESNDSRPDDCQCTPAMGDLPCWPCYREGFETPDSTAN